MHTNNRNNKNHSFDFDQPSKSGMKVPEGYFEDFDATIMAKISSSSAESQVQPKSGMKVPDGYFEDFEASMMAKIEASSAESQTPVIAIQKKVNYSWVVVALATAAALIWGAFWIYSPESEPTDDFAQIEITTEDWTYLGDVDDYLLAENFTLEELNEIELVETSNVSSEDLYEYLVDENISDYTLSLYQSN